MNEEILRMEELAINAFPSLCTELCEGWVLRFSEGYTYRANCVCPLYPGGKGLLDKVDECERKFFVRKLPCVFKLTDGAPQGLQTVLEQRGYTHVKTVHMMRLALSEIQVEPVSQSEVELLTGKSMKWFETSLQFAPLEESQNIRIRRAIFRQTGGKMLCLRAKAGMRSVGICLGVLERGYMGLFSLQVDKNYRRQGIATQLIQAAFATAKKYGAKTAYIQVHSDNKDASRLYEALGFRVFYAYCFKAKYTSDSKEIAE